MFTHCDVIDTMAASNRHKDRLFPRGFYGRFLSTITDNDLTSKKHVCATFFRICGAVKCLASDVMTNWPRAMHTARNNGFDHNVATGYHEKCKRHDSTGQGQRTTRIMVLIILPWWFLKSFSYHNGVDVSLWNTCLCHVLNFFFWFFFMEPWIV